MKVSEINGFNQSFQALQYVKVSSRCNKKNPQLVQKILKNLESNESFKAFCENNDVRVALSQESMRNNAAVKMRVFFKALQNADMPKFLQIADSLFNRYDGVFIRSFSGDVQQ